MNWLILMLVTHKWYKAYITPRTPQRLYLEMAKHRSAYIFILMRENWSPSLCKLSSNWYEYKVHRDKMLTLKKIKRIINVLTGRKLIFFSKRNSIAKEENVHSHRVGFVCLFCCLFVEMIHLHCGASFCISWNITEALLLSANSSFCGFWNVWTVKSDHRDIEEYFPYFYNI